jgi:hypothetical protein
MKPHHNVFFYYRGARSAEGPIGYDLQLENNTTKALINRLQYGGDRTVSEFMRLAAPKMNFGSPSSIKYRLQTSPLLVQKVRHRRIVTVTSGLDAAVAPAEPVVVSTIGLGLPDALIYHLPEFAVIIESKLGSTVTEGQLNAHASAAGWPDYQRVDLTWRQIHRVFQDVREEGNRESFLLEQFSQYLEMIGVTGFTGFNRFDFDYFIEGEADYRPTLRAKLGAFGAEVWRRLPPYLQSAYPDPYIGAFKERGVRGVWLAFRPVQDESDPFRQCNLTLELNESGLSINAVVRNGRFRDKKAIGYFYRNIVADTEAFSRYLQATGKDFMLVIFRRERRGGGSPRQGDEQWWFEYSQTLNSIVPSTVPMLLELLERVEFPGVHLRREFTRREVLAMSPEQVCDDAVASIIKISPILQFLRDGSFK